MDEMNWNLMMALLLNVIAVIFAFVTGSDDREQSSEPKADEPAPRPEPTTNQMMLSKWGHVG